MVVDFDLDLGGAIERAACQFKVVALQESQRRPGWSHVGENMRTRMIGEERALDLLRREGELAGNLLEQPQAGEGAKDVGLREDGAAREE